MRSSDVTHARTQRCAPLRLAARSPLAAVVLALAGCASPALRLGPDAVLLADEKPPFAVQLPEFELKDPWGKRHPKKDVVRQGLVLLVTAPTYANADAQRAWSKVLLASKPEHGRGSFAILQDMQPSWFRGTALSRMREAGQPDAPPLILVDSEGSLRRALLVEEDATVLLVYSPDGALLHWDTQPASEARARRAWDALGRVPPPPVPSTPE